MDWNEVVKSPKFQSLNDDDRYAVAQGFFDSTIAGHEKFKGMGAEDQNAVKAGFFSSVPYAKQNPDVRQYYEEDPFKEGLNRSNVFNNNPQLDPLTSVPLAAGKSLARGIEAMPGQLFGAAMQVPGAIYGEFTDSKPPQWIQDMSATGSDIYQGHTAQAAADFPETPSKVAEDSWLKFANPLWYANKAPESSAQTAAAVGATMAGQPGLAAVMYGLGEGGGAYQEVYQKNIAAGVDPETAHRRAQDVMLKVGLVNAAVGSGGVGQIAEGIAKPTMGQLATGMVTEGVGEAFEQNTPGFFGRSKETPFQMDPMATVEAGALGALTAGVMEGPGTISHVMQQAAKPSLPGLVTPEEQMMFSLASEVKKNKPELWAAFEKEVTPRVANGPLTAELRDRFIAFAAAHSVPAAQTQETEKPRIRVEAPIVDANSLQNLNTVTNQPLYQSAPKLKVSKLEDNYLKPLSTYSDTLYREASPESAISLIAENVAEDMRGQELFFSNNPDLAKGQGNNKGLLLEFSSGDLQGQVNTSKPTWDLSFSNGDAEFIGKYNSQEQYKNSLVSVTVPAGLKMQKRDAGLLRIALKSWNKVENSDGSVTYNKPSVLYQKGGENNGQQETVQEAGAQDAYAAQGNGQNAQGQEKEGLLKPRVRIQPTMMEVQPKAPAQILFEQIRKAAPHIPEEQARGFAFGVFDEFATSKAAEEGISKEEWYLKNLAGVTNKEPGKGLAQEGEAPTFYSQLSKTVEERMGKALLPAQLKALIGRYEGENWISGTGVKKDEVEETGIFDWLDELPQDQKVTKEAVQQWLDGNGVQVVEHELTNVGLGLQDALNKYKKARAAYEATQQESGRLETPEEKVNNDRLFAEMEQARQEYEKIRTSEEAKKKPRHTQYTLEGPREGDVEFVMTSPQAEEWASSDSTHYNDLKTKVPGVYGGWRQVAEDDWTFIPDTTKPLLQQPDSFRITKEQGKNGEEYQLFRNDFNFMGRFKTLDEAKNGIPKVEVPGRNIAWIRGNWRTDATGAKVFHIEEVQSQRHQKGHEEGYQLTEKQKAELKAERDKLGKQYYSHGFDTESEEGKKVGERIAEITDQLQKFNAVGNAPFKNSDKWMMLVFKKALRYAVENGAEKITFTTGEQQAKRWNKLTENIKTVKYWKGENDRYLVSMYDADGDKVQDANVFESELVTTLGTDLANKIKSSEGSVENPNSAHPTRRLDYPEGLTIGGEGMKNIYDQIFRKEIDKYIRKLDKQAKVEWEGAALPSQPKVAGYSVLDLQDNILYFSQDRASAEQYLRDHEEADTIVEGKREGTDNKVHSLTLTPALRDAVAGKSQALYQTKKGAISQDAIGRAVFHLFKAADFSTLIHESFHFFRRQLSKEEQKILEDWAGVKDGVWTREAEEKVARAGERYIRDGKAPAPRLKRMYEKFKQWMVAIYQTIRGSDLKFKFNPEVKAIFDKHLGDNELKTQAMVERVVSAGVLSYEQLNNIEQFISEVHSVISRGQRKTINFVVSDEELDKRVSARLKENGLEAEKQKMLERAKSGRLTIDEYGEEQLIGLRIVSDSCMQALKTGDKAEIEQNIDLSNAFGDEGTWIARNLRARGGTSLMNQAEKAKAFIAMQLFRFDKKTRFALGRAKEAASKSGDWAAYNRQYKLAKQKHINFLQNMKKGLLASGIDLLNLTDEQLSDPNVLYQIAYETEKAKTNVWDALLELKLGMLMASKTMHVVNIGTTALHALHDLTFRRWAEALVNIAWRDPRLASFGELLPMYKSLFFGRPEIKNQAGQVVHPARPGALWYGWHYMKETFMQERPVFEDEVLGRGQTSQHVGTYKHYINQHLIGKHERKTYTDFQVIDSKTGNVVKEFLDQQDADQFAQRQQAKENKKANPIANRYSVKQNSETHGVLPPGKYLEFAKGFLDASGKVVRLSPRIASTFDALFGSIYARMQVTAEANRLADTYVKEWQRLQKNPQAGKTVGPNTMKLVTALAAQCNNDAKELHRQIVDAMIDNYGSDAWINAMKEETRVTFHRPPGRLLKAFLSWRGQVPFMDHFVLFVNISSQLFKTGFQMSPLNLPQVVGAQIPSAIYKRVVKADGWEGSSREMTRQVAEQIVGIAALALMWGLLDLFAPGDDGPPVITGSTDLMPIGGNNANAGKDTYLNRTQGKAYSINLGGISYDYRNVQPFSSLLSSTADLYNDMFNAPDQVSWEERAANLYRHFMANFTNNTFLRTLFEMSNAMQTGDNMGKFMLNNVLQFVPTVVRQERAAADPYVKDYGVWGKGEDFDVKQAEIMQYKTGVADLDTLQPQVDLFGRELKVAQLDPTFKQGSFSSVVGAFVKHELNQMNPLKPQALPAKESVENQVWQLVQNYNRSYPDKKWFPAEPSKYLKLGSTVSGKPIASPLTREEYNDLCVRRGELLRSLLLRQLREGKLNTQNPIEAKEIAILQSDIRVADTVARSEVLKKRVQAEPSKWLEPLQSYYDKVKQEIEGQKKLVNSLQNLKAVR